MMDLNHSPVAAYQTGRRTRCPLHGKSCPLHRSGEAPAQRRSWFENPQDVQHNEDRQVESTPMTITSGTRRLLVALLVVLSVGLARRADAVTIADIIGLSQAGLSDDVLIALVDTDDTVFTLTASQIVQLKTAGVGERVIVAMLWQGRTPVAEPPTVPEAQAAAPDQWSSVFGKFGNAHAVAEAGFKSATQNVSRLGLTFGGGCFFGHGVNVRGGSATFALVAYRIE